MVIDRVWINYKNVFSIFSNASHDVQFKIRLINTWIEFQILWWLYRHLNEKDNKIRSILKWAIKLSQSYQLLHKSILLWSLSRKREYRRWASLVNMTSSVSAHLVIFMANRMIPLTMYCHTAPSTKFIFNVITSVRDRSNIKPY